MWRPPLLTEEGNTDYPNQFVHTFIDRAYSCKRAVSDIRQQLYAEPVDRLRHHKAIYTVTL